MIPARIHQGRVELDGPIPPEWEGQRVKIVPLTPDDPIPDLEACLAGLHGLGPVELEEGEREQVASAWAELDRVSKAALEAAAGAKP